VLIAQILGQAADVHSDKGTSVQAGFIRGSVERRLISQQELSQPGMVDVTLCPFDRAECRDHLMAISLQDGSGNTLVMGYRSVSYYPDVEIDDAAVDAAGTRDNVDGLSVIYATKDGTRFLDRALLDFNQLFGDFPDALPKATMVCPSAHPACIRRASDVHAIQHQ
jgi:hypothetical protein